ncbi:hypothetical protein PJP14_29650, partial [Mycobacterium kansasii]
IGSKLYTGPEDSKLTVHVEFQPVDPFGSGPTDISDHKPLILGLFDFWICFKLGFDPSNEVIKHMDGVDL